MTIFVLRLSQEVSKEKELYRDICHWKYLLLLKVSISIALEQQKQLGKGKKKKNSAKSWKTENCFEFEPLNSKILFVFKEFLSKFFWKNLNDHLHAFNCVKSKKQKIQRLSLACLNKTTKPKSSNLKSKFIINRFLKLIMCSHKSKFFSTLKGKC